MTTSTEGVRISRDQSFSWVKVDRRLIRFAEKFLCQPEAVEVLIERGAGWEGSPWWDGEADFIMCSNHCGKLLYEGDTVLVVRYCKSGKMIFCSAACQRQRRLDGIVKFRKRLEDVFEDTNE